MAILLDTEIRVHNLPDGYDLTGKLIKHDTWGFGRVIRHSTRVAKNPHDIDGDGDQPTIDVDWGDNFIGHGFEVDYFQATVMVTQ